MTKSLTLAAATAITAVGFLAVPVPAQAVPMIPLAPAACTQYAFPGSEIRQSNGWRVDFASEPGEAVATGDSGAKMFGAVSGSVGGGTADFTIYWKGGATGHYTGTVSDSGFGHGTTGDATWDSVNPFQCITPPAAPAPQPAPAPQQPAPAPEQPAPAQQKTATVTSDVDVYDVPGGNGTIIGTLRQGQQVPFNSCRSDNWCSVGFAAGPGGTGWVWGEFLKS